MLTLRPKNLSGFCLLVSGLRLGGLVPVAATMPLLLSAPLAHSQSSFLKARPVWPATQTKVINARIGFRAVIEAGQAPGETMVRIAAASVYRLFVNGEFAGYGPARSPVGYARVDEWPIGSRLHPGSNIIAVEVSGYNANSFYIPKQTPFLQAEVISAGKPSAATAVDGEFRAQLLNEAVTKTQRYSYQRPSSEAYRLAPGYTRWRTDLLDSIAPLQLAEQPRRELLPRRVPLPDFTVNPAATLLAEGTMQQTAVDAPSAQPLWKDESLTGVPDPLDGYTEQELKPLPSIELQRWKEVSRTKENVPLDAERPIRLTAGRFAIVDFSLNRAGFLGMALACSQQAVVYVSFDEISPGGDVDFKRLDTVNLITYNAQPGAYQVESMEPYVVHFAKFMVARGTCSVSHIHVRDYANPDVWTAEFASSDSRLNPLFEAARETFRQNSVDVFTDCPSRERAAWTGDSFFTARAAVRFALNTDLEKNFFENFALPKDFPGLPPGMIPMLYPGDVIGKDGYLPGYTFWFVLQLAEYAERGGDPALIAALKPRVLALLHYFEGFRNSDGMLENLQGWVFLEWSDANKYTDGVNFPYNMMYAATLSTVAKLYGMPELDGQADALRTRIREMAYDGHFFVDHAVRRDGRLTVAPEHTEAAQYFAFFFGTATRERYPELWKTLATHFGPDRSRKGLFPDVAPTNVIFGQLLRIELLSAAGRNQQILDEFTGGFLQMAETTGTLWEHIDARASTDHGLMSHIAFVLYRDVLGVSSLDWGSRRLRLMIPDVALTECSGILPTPEGPVSVRWRRVDGSIRYHVEAPSSYGVDVRSAANLPLIVE